MHMRWGGDWVDERVAVSVDSQEVVIAISLYGRCLRDSRCRRNTVVKEFDALPFSDPAGAAPKLALHLHEMDLVVHSLSQSPFQAQFIPCRH